MDRPLRLAGQVFYRTAGGIRSALYDSERPIAVFPSAAIHFNMASSLQPKLEIEDTFVATYGVAGTPPLIDQVAEKLGITAEQIVNSDLRFVAGDRPTLFSGGLIASPRLDNLASTFVCLRAFVEATPESGVMNCLVVFDNEEIGSLTKNGALSPFIDEQLSRIISNRDELRILKASSILLNADAGHASHPNFEKLTDPIHIVKVGAGIVTERVPTGCLAHAGWLALHAAAKKLGKNIQYYAEKSAGAGGTTNAGKCEVMTGIQATEIGTPVLGMHSFREFGSIVDMEDELAILREIYSHTPVLELGFE
jgi:aspartyl aminopeptidase